MAHKKGETPMPIGASGRIVIEADPELKHLLHAILQKEGTTLKDWFTEQAQKYIYDDRQLTLDFDDPSEDCPFPPQRVVR